MASVLKLTDVSIVRDGNNILDSVNWTVEPDERWVILGPNGAGKTTMLQVAAAALHPSSGTASILGETIGDVDLFELRPRIGFASSAMAKRIPATESVLNVVMTAAYSVTGRWNETYEEIDERRARRVLTEWKLDHLVDRPFGKLSDGEQKRVQIARAIMTDPEILLLDRLQAWILARGRNCYSFSAGMPAIRGRRRSSWSRIMLRKSRAVSATRFCCLEVALWPRGRSMM